ncbi:MAG TPA: hypothetical protein VD998_01145 [Verrucomicrobiae bacterium]|nr:hypothetical protein [Verrucomicrobiae bacterium]
MTDDQFETMMERLEDRRSNNLREILAAILPSRDDRDRLIRIEGELRALTNLMGTTRTEDLNKIELANKKADAAHRRIDSQFLWSVGTIIVTVGGMLLTALFVYMRLDHRG